MDVVIESDGADNLFATNAAAGDAAEGTVAVGAAPGTAQKFTVGGALTRSGSSLAGIRLNATLTPGLSASAEGLELRPTLVEHSSGAHPRFSSPSFYIPTITGEAATVTAATTLYIEGAPTAGGVNYALHVDAGKTQLDGELEVDGDLNHDGSNVGFLGVAPQAQQATIVDADGTLADITTKFNTLLADLEGYGLLASV